MHVIDQLRKSKPGQTVTIEYRGWAFLAKFLLVGWVFTLAGLALWEPESLMFRLMAHGGPWGQTMAVVMLVCICWILAQMFSRRLSRCAMAHMPYSVLGLCLMGMALVAAQSGGSVFSVIGLCVAGVGSLGGAVNATFTD